MNGNLVIVSALTIVIPSTEHYIPPPDMCLLAKMCNHTWVSECGIETNSSRKRLFLDNCDMYEYNCDYKNEYIKIEIKECPTNCNKMGNTVASTNTSLVNSETQSSSTTSVTAETIASSTSFEPTTNSTYSTTLPTNSDASISLTPATTSTFHSGKDTATVTSTASNTT